MQKIIIDTEKLSLEVFNFVVTDNEIIVAASINEKKTLSDWFKLSREFRYNLQVTSKDVVNISIPLNDITSIQYEKN